MTIEKQSEYLVASEYPTITTLKLGRNVHNITKRDVFFDNGACVQLLKEHPMKIRYGAKDTVVLTKTDLAHLAKFNSVTHVNHEYRHYGRVWSIVEPDERFLVMGYEDEGDVKNRVGMFLGGHGYFENAFKQRQEGLNRYLRVKIFDSSGDEVVF